METESFRLRVKRQSLDVVHVILFVTRWNRIVDSRLREWMALSKDVLVDVALKNGLDESDVLLLRDTSTVVDLGTKHVEYFIRDVVVGLDKLLKLATTDEQVFISERIGNVPANRTELSSILDDSMEEAESKEHLLVNFWLCAFIEILCCQSVISLKDVRPETRGRFKSHLDGVLQDGHREVRVWHTSQPKTEVTMLCVVNLLDDGLKFRHPRDCQMTVHEKDPSTASQVGCDHLSGFRTLTSSEGNLFTLLGHIGIFSEAFPTGDRIRTLRKDKDQRRGDVTVFVRLG